MPTILRYLSYRIYFFSNENNEGVHVHICRGSAATNSTKIALAINGGTVVINNKSRISHKDLAKICEYINVHRDIIINSWFEYHGYIKFDY